MNAMRLLAKLTAKGVVIGGAGGGGLVEISRADVAAAIAFAGVSTTADRLIRWLYCGDAAQEPLLLAALMHELRRTVPVGRPLLYRMVRLALYELSNSSVCRTCAGAGRKGLTLCEVCGGGGLKALAQRERASLLELSHTTFRRSHEAQADAVYQYVAGLANGAMASVAHQFSDRAA